MRIALFFFKHLGLNKSSYTLKKEKVKNRKTIQAAELVETEISDTTFKIIYDRLRYYFRWVEEYSVDKHEISLTTHHNFPSELINHFVNQVLIIDQKKGESHIAQSVMSLNHYYNYLAFHGLTDMKNIKVLPKFRENARENTKKRTVVKYLTPSLRGELYNNAKSIRNECLLRLAGECGLRAKETQGFLLKDCVVRNKKHAGILSLFDQMESNPSQREFEYWLQGRFSKGSKGKGGKSRMVYLYKSTLKRLKAYYERERPNCRLNSFFVTEPSSNYLNPVSSGTVSGTFREAKNQVLDKQAKGLLSTYLQSLEAEHTYHVLRHSFGTDKFHELILERGMRIDDVTSTSQPYLTVAALLGHSISGKYAPATTASYIRSCRIKDKFERMECSDEQ